MSRYTDGFQQGSYHVVNRGKYMGSANGGGATVAIYRSSWERRLAAWLDSNDSVVKWGSELICIPYVNKCDNIMHRYYIDFNFTIKDEKGKLKTFWCEVKPSSETKIPQKPKRITESSERNYKLKLMTYIQNLSKWEAAKKAAYEKGAIFIILTEKNCQFLNHKN